MKPTPEQIDCVEKFKTGETLRVGAYAGTGKTTTLTLLADAGQGSGLYLAFNKSIATDAAKKFPRNIQCSTVHSLAFRAMVGKFGAPKMTRNFNGRTLAQSLKLKGHVIDDGLTISDRGWGFLVGETLKRWQRSSFFDITYKSVPKFAKLAALSADAEMKVKQDIAETARRAWDKMMDPKSDLSMGHDGYLKAWAMTGPQLAGDFIFLDEAQDTNGVVLGILKNQTGQLIAVGDKHQQIYEWRGAVNAMTELPTINEARLSTSFRFGPEIAGFATRILKLLNEDLPLTGNPEMNSKVGPVPNPKATLFRTNSALIEDLITRLEDGGYPYVVGGVGELEAMLQATEQLQNGRAVEYPLEFFGFTDWTDVKVFSETEEGAELRRWVELVEKYGVQKLRHAFSSLPKSEAHADAILSTGHKAKGREWNTVRLAHDFLGNAKPDPDKANTLDSELRLLYVAGTRARKVLDVPEGLMDKINKLDGGAKPKAEAA